MLVDIICNGCNKTLSRVELSKEELALSDKNYDYFLCDDCKKIQATREKVRKCFKKWNSSKKLEVFERYEVKYVKCPICGGRSLVIGENSDLTQVFCSFCHGYYYRFGDTDWKVFIEGTRIRYDTDVWNYYPLSKFNHYEKTENSKKLEVQFVNSIYEKLKNLGL